MKDLHRLVAMGAAITLLVGCSLLPGGRAGTIDGEWVLQTGTHQGQAIPIVPAARITLDIDGTQVGGRSACNSYFGTIQVNGTRIIISQLGQTEMACLDPNAMASESAYLAALAAVTDAARSGASLVLSGPQVELRFTVVPPVPDAGLIGPVWALESLISGEAVSSTVGAATLQLHPDGTLEASTGCRTVTGKYVVSGIHLDVTLDGFDAFGCAEPIGAQDAHVLQVIGEGFDAVIDGNALTLTAGNQGLGYRVASS